MGRQSRETMWKYFVMFGRMVSSTTIELLRFDGLVGKMRADME